MPAGVGFVPGAKSLDYYNGSNSPPIGPTNNTFGSPSTFSAAVNTNASDYDTIMKNYQELLKKQSDTNNPVNNFKPISPTLTSYSSSPDVTAGLANLKDLSATGGYSQSGIADLRERGISPIRSIYQNAQQNLDRSKALQGGYSPNYAAATAKMSRDEASQIGKATTDVNAGIAQNVAQNRLSIAPSYSSAAAQENAARTAVEQRNADEIDRINELNAQMALQYNQTANQGMFGTIEGMRSLYGTNPGLVNTFGTQVGQAAQLGQGQQQINNQRRNSDLAFAGNFMNG